MYVAAVDGCYKLLNVSLTWDDAGSTCESLYNHSHLVIISSAAEQDAVEALINSANRQCPLLVCIARTTA